MPATRWLRRSLLLSLLAGGIAHATITQVDGTIVPSSNLLQTDFDAIPEPIDAILDASELPEVFLPNTAGVVVFTDIAEHAGYENTFGWYNLGDDVLTPAGRARNLHPVLGACVPMVDAVGAEALSTLTDGELLSAPHNRHHHGIPAHYTTGAEAGSAVSVDFGAELTAGHYKGGFIGFYLITPQGNAAGTQGCGDVKVDGSGDSYFGYIYYTQKDLNDDGDFVHHLVFTANSADDRFYFCFEDLFRGGDNDFTDMTTRVDGLTPPCVPQPEICDGLDNDCDDVIDELDPDLSDIGLPCTCDGVGMTCQGGPRDGVCQTGETVCVTATIECQPTVSPSNELCDGLDNNCNGAVDDNPTDVGVDCDGPDLDQCDEGVTYCSSGVVACGDTTGTATEVCNGVDDDCNDIIDDNPSDVGAACDGLDGDDCIEGVIECIDGAPTCNDDTSTTAELCNGVDDDCDGAVDEGLNDLGPCGTDVGACSEGSTRCIGGAPVCQGGVGPVPEICDALDNDCDGLTNELTGDPGDVGGGLVDVGSACGSDIGECTPGVIICQANALTCDGAYEGGPELCNGLDDDCNAVVDDALTDVGTSCGTTDTGECDYGTTVCVAGAVQCLGEVGPVPETCNLLDDDCNGVVDNAPVDVGSPCGIGTGVCNPGTLVCTAAGPECQGETTGTNELCNGIDDDCNGIIDDNPTGIDESCGDEQGACELGLSKCINGGLQCVGGYTGTTETCNGIDDDCDGTIDEGDLCEGGVCIDGGCSAPCESGEFNCPLGDMCLDGYCIPDPCYEVACAADEQGGAQVCVDGTCEPICDNVQCPAELICRDRDGLCVPNNCHYLPLCADNEVCTESMCVADPCYDVACASDQFCRDGACIDSCGPVDCSVGYLCHDGMCQPTGCAEDCWNDEICNATTGTCDPSPCVGENCGVGEACDPTTGTCIPDPCSGITCPAQESCLLGDCYDPGTFPGDRPDAGPPPQYVTPGGGSGCNAAEKSSSSLVSCLLVLAALLALRWRSLARPAVTAALAMLPMLATGCEVNPFCITCAQTAAFDSGIPQPLDAGVDAQPDAGYGCDSGVVQQELCDGIDNDCDGLIDEDFDLTNDLLNCGECDVVCDKTGARSTCEESACVLLECFPGHVDLNEDIDLPYDDTDGCEYPCYVSNGGTEACDGLDNDCDGETDEHTDFLSDNLNCGECGRVCNLFQATANCQAGVCTFNPATDCANGFSDLDGNPNNGCEYPCTADGTEVCDLVDNDCDGEVDEGFELTSNAEHCGQCNLACSFPHATPSCAAGTCGFNPLTDCAPGWVDSDGIQLNGCEYQCTATGVEVCDLEDNDCNGIADDTPTDVGDSCNLAPSGVATGLCTNTGTVICSRGVLVCADAPAPAPELCDLADNDCDGITDEDPVDVGALCMAAVGICSAGVLTCTPAGIDCVRAVEATEETCNGLDDNCNGVIDDTPIDAALGTTCGDATGRCEQGIWACIDGLVTCDGDTGPALEICDGFDNDCDTGVDEGLTQSCYTGTEGTDDIGECRRGYQACIAANYSGPCIDEVVPTLEQCNGLDDDCDGSVDEATGGAPLTQSCYTGTFGTAGVGTCVSGTETCAFGSYGVCSGEVTPADDFCGDGLDTDCDGNQDADEGCLLTGDELRADAPGGDLGSNAGQFHSFDAEVASSGNNLYLVWSDHRSGEVDIYLRRSTDGGDTWGDITELTGVDSAGETSQAAVRPMVAAAYDAALGADRVYVLYQQVQSNDRRQIRVLRSVDGGTTFAKPSSPADGRLDGGEDSFHHHLALNDDGTRVAVVWEQLDTSTLERNIEARVSADAGDNFAPTRIVNANSGATPVAGNPRAAVADSGRYLFVWRETRAGTTPNIYVDYSDDPTTAFDGSTEVRLDNDSGDTRQSDYPRMLAAASNVYVVWQDISTVPGGGSDIVFARSANDAVSFGTEQILDDPGQEVSSSFTPTMALDPRTALTNDDRIYIAWEDRREGTQIYAAVSSNAGASFGAAARASSEAGVPISGRTRRPRITYAGQDTAVVSYINDLGTGVEHVFATTTVDAGATWDLTHDRLDDGTGVATAAVIATASGGAYTLGAIAAWVDFRDAGAAGYGDIYVRRIGR